MNAYLAARYGRREELLAYRRELEEMGIGCTARWLNGDHEWRSGAVDDGHSLSGPPAEARRYASEDIDDLAAADTFICFSEEPRSSHSRGGRHVEMGIALALAKRLIVVGPRENVFHCLPAVHHCPTWTDTKYLLAEWLLLERAEQEPF
jgi:hypothetical protein